MSNYGSCTWCGHELTPSEGQPSDSAEIMLECAISGSEECTAEWFTWEAVLGSLSGQ